MGQNWYVDADRELIDWDTAVVGNVTTTNIYRIRRIPLSSDGNAQLFISTGLPFTDAQITRAIADTSDDALPASVLDESDSGGGTQGPQGETGPQGEPGVGGGSGPLWVMRFTKYIDDLNQNPAVAWEEGEMIWPLDWADDLPAFPADPEEEGDNRIAVAEAGLYSGQAYISLQVDDDPGDVSANLEWSSSSGGVAVDIGGENGWMWSGELVFGPLPAEAPPLQSFYCVVEWPNAVESLGGAMTVYLTRWA